MSEPDGAEIGRRIGDHSADIMEDDAVACCAAIGTAQQPDFARHPGATARGQVKVKVILGKVFPVGPARHSGHQPASRVGEGLAGPAVPIGGVAHGFLHRRSGTRFAPLHQFQCPQIVGSSIMPVSGPCRGD